MYADDNDDKLVNGSSRALRWDLRADATAPLRTLTWDTYVAVNGDPLDLAWGLVGEVSALPSRLLWDTYAEVDAATLELLWRLYVAGEISQVDAYVLTLRWGPYELILVDDGSKDRSGDICDTYSQKDARIEVIHKENGGLSDARNAGTKAAQGEYIVYIDSDDFVISSVFLEDLYKQALDGTPDIILYKFQKYFDDTGKMEGCNFSLPVNN
jgi:hypothetical protein